MTWADQAGFGSGECLCYKRAPPAPQPPPRPVSAVTNPIFCALDRPDLEGTLALARALAPHVGGIKLGLEFFSAQGPQGVVAVAALGLPIFLDLKLHDIPNTVAGAVREVGRLGVAMLTVHAAGGRAMLEAAAAAAPGGLAILAVTVLTSLDEADLASIGVAAAPAPRPCCWAGWRSRPGSGAGMLADGDRAAACRARPDASPRGAGPPAGGGRRRSKAHHGTGRGAGARGRRAGDRPSDHPGGLARAGGSRLGRTASRGGVRWR